MLASSTTPVLSTRYRATTLPSSADRLIDSGYFGPADGSIGHGGASASASVQRAVDVESRAVVNAIRYTTSRSERGLSVSGGVKAGRTPNAENRRRYSPAAGAAIMNAPPATVRVLATTPLSPRTSATSMHGMARPVILSNT